jgi:anaerobic magnesium-protoporphyrin IX monomethyl ester cyclase
MNTALISPPHAPLYINTDYHFVEIGEVVGHLRKMVDVDVQVLDGCAPGVTWYDVIQILVTEPNLVIIHCALENMTEVGRLITIIRDAYPSAKISCYGRGAYHVCHLLKQLRVDWIVVDQDWELALEGIIEAIMASDKVQVPGTWTLIGGEYAYGGKGKLLNGEWSLPALDLLPVEQYRALITDQLAGRGIGNDFEFAVGISRGCDVYCGYCPIPDVMGRREIYRKDLGALVDYLDTVYEHYKLGSVSLFGANFTKDSAYVHEFCELLAKKSSQIRWDCATSSRYLDNELIEVMAKGGCRRIAIGVESIRISGQNRFSGRVSVTDLKMLAGECNKQGIMLIGLLMAGLPGQSREELAYTIETVVSAGATPRPMIYYDYRELQNAQTLDDVFWSNRKTTRDSHIQRQRCIPTPELMLVANKWTKWLELYKQNQLPIELA